MAALIVRAATGASRHETLQEKAFAWAESLAVSRQEALAAMNLPADAPLFPRELIAEGNRRAAEAEVAMGGPGDLDLFYGAILTSGARRVIETGVAYGWSSLAALAALRETDGQLVSVDMPYPKASNEAFVGLVVPADWRDRWTLIRKPDRNGLAEAIARFGGEIDLCHYDSDKSYPGRMFASRRLWRALCPGGIFISDDIGDNFAFRDFFERIGVEFAIIRSQGKHVGIARKPA